MTQSEPRTAEDDGLPIPEVGRWALDKYRLFGTNATLFSTGMKYKWERRVFVDLYAGGGYSRIRGANTVVLGSPLISLTVPDPFDDYIFCEQKPHLLEASERRARTLAPAIKPLFLSGDCNSLVEEIVSNIPTGSRTQRVLTLCFVDAFNLEGVRFETLRRFADRYTDFFCLLALHMDANRNYDRYVGEDAQQVDEFLGYEEWRPDWEKAKWIPTAFPRFLASKLSERMSTLGYLATPLHTMIEMRSDEKNLPLYHLALFSRHERAYDFWEKVRTSATDQRRLFPL